jgi:hypothetical protein
MPSCRTCNMCNLKENVCDAEMWDRNSEEEKWLHSNEDFIIYIEKDRFCSEYEAK